jgi:hypothetical protein
MGLTRPRSYRDDTEGKPAARRELRAGLEKILQLSS